MNTMIIIVNFGPVTTFNINIFVTFSIYILRIVYTIVLMIYTCFCVYAWMHVYIGIVHLKVTMYINLNLPKYRLSVFILIAS